MMYLECSGAQANSKIGIELLQQAAVQGDKEAQFDLGYIYWSGSKGVPNDYSKAAEWIQNAAHQGHATAQWILGLMYRDGSGVPQDDHKAMEWLSKAGEQGQPAAVSYLTAAPTER
jgi:hypothetical protein